MVVSLSALSWVITLNRKILNLQAFLKIYRNFHESVDCPHNNFDTPPKVDSVPPDSVLELKDSCIILVSIWGQKHGREIFGVKSICCILSNLNLLLNYSVVAPIILINNLLTLNISRNTIYIEISSVSKYFWKQVKVSRYPQYYPLTRHF